MISDLQILNIYSAMARHAAESQKVSATNIAHADTPGYKASEVESFEEFLSRAMQAGMDPAAQAGFRIAESTTPSSPNGNNVSLEQEIFNSAEAMGQHNMALTIYSKSIDLLRTALGKPR